MGASPRQARGRILVRACLVAAVAGFALSAAAEAPGALAATLRLRSGSLEAVVGTDPWSLSFRQDRGKTLAETPGAPASPYGTLGFGTGPVPAYGGAPSQPPSSSWWHATRALKVEHHGVSLLVELATNDPLGRTLAVVLDPVLPGVIRADVTVRGVPTGTAGVTQIGESFRSDPGEHFSGFGGRENLLDQAGQTVENWSEEGTWLPADRAFIPPFIEPWTDSNRDDGAYFPMPWLVSSRGYGFLLENTELSQFRLRSDRSDAWDVEADAAHLDFRVYAGPRPLDVVRRFSSGVGRQPPPAAPWVLGPWWQPTGPESATLPQRFRRQDVPGSLLMTYTHYLPGGSQAGRTVQERALVARLHAAGYAVTTYFNPMISFQYQPVFGQAQAAGLLLRNEAGQPYPIHYNQYVVAQVDFTNAAAVAFYKRLLQEAVDNGYDGWMEDFGEYTPPDAQASSGTGATLHNLYPSLYHCAAYALTSREPRPVIEFDRSGWTGSAACSPVVWSGDPTTDWDAVDGLPAMITQGLNYGYSGIGFYGSDVGGFFSIMAAPTSTELLIRWLEMGAFSGVMRTEADGFAAPDWSTGRAQIWDPAVEPVWRRYAKLRTQLFPYIAAAAARYESRGIPLMEALGLAYPDDPHSWQGPARYLFGSDLLVAPVTTPDTRSAAVPLPPGRWRNFWDAVGYSPRDGAFHLRPAPALAGGRTVAVAAPLNTIPLFVRAGALLAMIPPDVATLASYGKGVVHLRDRSRLLHLLAWPAGRSSAIALGTTLRSQLSRGRWRLRVTGVAPRRLQIEAALPGCVTAVSWHGRRLSARHFQHRAGALRLAVRGTGTLIAAFRAACRQPSR